MNKLIDSSKSYLLTTVTKETLDKALLIAVATPCIAFMVDKLHSVVFYAMDKGYDLTCENKIFNIKLSQSAKS